MRYKLTFLAGAAVGYVLGARAGRARYEQISDLASRVAETDAMQHARETATQQAAHLADLAKATVGEKVGAAVAEGRHRVEDALGDRLPERLRSNDADDAHPATATRPTSQTSPSAPNGAGAGI